VYDRRCGCASKSLQPQTPVSSDYFCKWNQSVNKNATNKQFEKELKGTNEKKKEAEQAKGDKKQTPEQQQISTLFSARLLSLGLLWQSSYRETTHTHGSEWWHCRANHWSRKVNLLTSKSWSPFGFYQFYRLRDIRLSAKWELDKYRSNIKCRRICQRCCKSMSWLADECYFRQCCRLFHPFIGPCTATLSDADTTLIHVQRSVACKHVCTVKA